MRVDVFDLRRFSELLADTILDSGWGDRDPGPVSPCPSMAR
jgi:hypothetical protein